MTYKEVKDSILRIINDSGIYGNPELTKEAEDALFMAAEVLEKQIPKKVEQTIDNSWGISTKQPVCPVCDYYVTKTYFFGEGEKITYCDHCGQAIDWSDWSDD